MLYCYLRLDAWESFHKIECQQLDLITGANLGKNAMLAFRILTSSGKIYLEYVVNKVEEEEEGGESIRHSRAGKWRRARV